jgi:DNA-binding winged helix-turn-helix (wHTH) protein/Tol biopolymer transport system component
MAQKEGNSVVHFGIFEADLDTGELRRNGAKIRLQEQPFQLLRLLLRKPGDVVTREELRANLWPADTFVDFDHGLNAAVKRLRDALGDSAENPRFVETFARRGYRFIAPVDTVGSTPAQLVKMPAVSTPQAKATAPVFASSIAFRSGKGVVALAVVVSILLVGMSAGWHAGRNSAAALRPAEHSLTGNPQNDPVWTAALSPDGKYVAFADKAGLFLRVLSSNETHALPAADDLKTRNVTWFPDSSHLLASRAKWPERKSSLWSVSTLGGPPRKLADDADQAAVSPDGAHIVFVRGDYDRQEVWMMDADGGHLAKLLDSYGAEYGSVTWAQDSRHILILRAVYKIAYDDDRVSVVLCDTITGQTQSILDDSRLWNALALSPDHRLIYSMGETPPNRTDSNLWAQQLDAHSYMPVGKPVRITSGPDGKARIGLSSDGKRLTFLRMSYSPQVYIADVGPSNTRSGSLERLRLDERRNFPYDWTHDSKSLIFTSDRDGNFHLYKQSPDQLAPDLLVGGDENIFLARLDPAGTSVLYLLAAHPSDLTGQVRLMRVPVDGGVSQLVLSEPGINNIQCARRDSDVCIFSQSTSDRLTFYKFDPVSGKHEVLKTVKEPDWFLQNWSLSPDGTTLVLAKKHRGVTADIHVVAVDGKNERMLRLENWFAISYIDWAADGKSVWVNASNSSGTPTLLNVGLNGKVTPFLEEPEKELGWAIPSPDGRHIAVWRGDTSSNAWLLEGF